MLAMNRSHGGAIEDCARALQDVIGEADRTGVSLAQGATAVLAEYRKQGIRVAGFGHRLHTADPRTARLFVLAQEAGVAGRYVDACRALESALAAQTGRPLPINVDGAIGAVLCELGFEPEVMNGFFILARTAGLIAHAREEMTREKVMRRIDFAAAEYDGPPPRDLS